MTTDTLALTQWVDAFLLDRRAGNCTASTIDTYRIHLERFVASGVGASPLAVQGYLNGLRARMKPISVHKHYRTLRAFFSWTVNVGVLSESPLRGFRMKLPRTMPRVPQDSDVRALLRVCGNSWEGKRNSALVALLADSGLRISEALRLRLEDVRFNERTLRVLGKGQKEAPAHFGAEAAAPGCRRQGHQGALEAAPQPGPLESSWNPGNGPLRDPGPGSPTFLPPAYYAPPPYRLKRVVLHRARLAAGAGPGGTSGLWRGFASATGRDPPAH